MYLPAAQQQQEKAQQTFSVFVKYFKLKSSYFAMRVLYK
jgi:hypothetical protein